MITSYRLDVLLALTALLKQIVPVEDEHDFDLSNAVFRGRAFFGAESPDTMIAILESPRPDVGSTAGDNGEERSERWPLLVQGWTNDDPENPTDPLYLLLQVVEDQLQKVVETRPASGLPLYPEAYMLGKRVTTFTFGPGVVRPPSEGVSSKAFFYLPVYVGLVKSKRAG